MANVKLPALNRGQYRTAVLDESGKMNQTWTRKLQTQDIAIQNIPTFFFQPASVRATTNPAQFGVGSFFYETDTKNFFTSDGKVWHQLGTAIS